MVSPKLRTAFLIGAGAVENAWTPVYAGLSDVCGEEFPQTAVAASAIFADMIWQLRWLHHARRTERRQERRLHIDRACKRTLARYRRIKDRVAIQLRTAERAGGIRTRPQLSTLIDELVGPARCVLTTNWDMTLERFFKEHYRVSPPVVHLHGTSADTDSLFLPSEVIEEPYRPWRVNRMLGGRLLFAMQQIADAEELLVYGLSLDPVDAELARVVAEGAKKLKRIVVVDLEPGVVADRLKALLLPKRPVIEQHEVQREGQEILRLSIDAQIAAWAQSEADRRMTTLATLVQEALSGARGGSKPSR